jgi:hypothetical protein
MMYAQTTFTADFWAINQVAQNGSNYMDPAEAAALTPEGVRQAVYGSKLTLTMELLTLSTTWSLKG